MSSFKISFKSNSQFKQDDFFIGKDKNKIRTLGGAEYVRGKSSREIRPRRRQAVTKVSKNLMGIIRIRVSRAQSKNKMIQNRVMPPGIASLSEKDRAVVQDVMKSLVTAAGTGGRRSFVYGFKRS